MHKHEVNLNMVHEKIMYSYVHVFVYVQVCIMCIQHLQCSVLFMYIDTV